MYCIPEKKEYSLNYLRVEGVEMSNFDVAEIGCKDSRVKLQTFVAHVRLGALPQAYCESRYMFISDDACREALRSSGVSQEQIDTFMQYAKEGRARSAQSLPVFTGFRLGDCSELAL